ncbi:hypothetical protein MKC91_11590 [[Clostridium] innocuum]|nr:hypothetical protein [Erysipelotrichaceae bacterium]MCR0381552.1 hypothetical protein [[Clostridium] innocuum]MCR0413040.1 hypothetical protein [[Clostridium] innocuum]MCR0534150.1 hypothetical protein [[Clostridium] innocuum]MCR0539043.1 hypothetical protein [[Clostridium] innocuum]
MKLREQRKGCRKKTMLCRSFPSSVCLLASTKNLAQGMQAVGEGKAVHGNMCSVHHKISLQNRINNRLHR